jgi:2-polyprenyl-3-methyl-5-hydroxy-6-metoxy-1,4-benzoquinol methylase
MPNFDSASDFAIDLSDFSGFDTTDMEAQIDLDSRKTNPYDVLDVVEKDRLAFQRSLTRVEDVTILRRMLKDVDHPLTVLDLGCNNADYLCDRLEALDMPLDAVFGVDVDEGIIKEASENYPDCNFIALNLEDVAFVDKLLAFLDGAKPDVVILSMILLHVQNPCDVLTSIRKVIPKGCKIFIRDMDDALSTAFPDEGVYDRVLAISDRVKYTGNRHNGREILYSLKKAGYSRIKCEEVTVDTTGMTLEQRRLLFLVNFGYIRGDVALAAKGDPATFEQDNQWYNQVAFPTLQSLFDRDDFYYRMGIILFTAEA